MPHGVLTKEDLLGSEALQLAHGSDYAPANLWHSSERRESCLGCTRRSQQEKVRP